MLPHRLKFILNRNLTIANLLDQAIDLRPDRVLFETDEDMSRYGLDASGITGAERSARGEHVVRLVLTGPLWSFLPHPPRWGRHARRG